MVNSQSRKCEMVPLNQVCLANTFCKEAYGHLAAKCFASNLKLFRLRPKVHFQQHLTMLMGPMSAPVAFSALSY